MSHSRLVDHELKFMRHPPISQRSNTEMSVPELRQRLAFLAHDMRTYSNRPDAESRLSSSIWPHCIGPPYLNEDEISTAMSTTLHSWKTRRESRSLSEEDAGLTLNQYLDREVGKVVESRRLKASRDTDQETRADFVICTSHDLAPILQRALGLDRGFHESKAFKKGCKAWEKEVRKK